MEAKHKTRSLLQSYITDFNHNLSQLKHYRVRLAAQILFNQKVKVNSFAYENIFRHFYLQISYNQLI